MIYTITLNPALDYMVSVNDFKLGMTNRTTTECIMLGGKGINVSLMLSHLHMENVALGFVGGFTGDEVRRRLDESGVKHHFVSLQEGITRINVKLTNYDGTEINGMGPSICEDDLIKLYKIIDTLKEGDMLVLAGSIPPSLPCTIYEDICGRLVYKKIKFVVDTSGDSLKKVLPKHPFFIKPNKQELCELFHVSEIEQQDILHYAVMLQEMGALNVLVSLGGEGAVLLSEEGKHYYLKAPKGEPVNSVGAGDSMVAGFLVGYLNTGSYEEALKMGVAAGSASAFMKEFATESDVQAVYKRLDCVYQ